MERLAHDILEAMVQCFGKSFHFKDVMASFLQSCGVSQSMVEKYRDEPKFPWARHLLTDLGQTEEGYLLQRAILTGLCRLRSLPDENVPDRNAGLAALRRLKELANEQKLVARETKKQELSRSQQHAERMRIIQDRRRKLEDLRNAFNAAAIDTNRQRAGYTPENILKELFPLFEIEYRKSYRTSTEQIDGHFHLDGFDYLVEAKWRTDRPTEKEIGAFKHKVDSKLKSTRGLFVSVPSYRAEVIKQFNCRGSNVILMDSSHLVEVLEGRVNLCDLLRCMVRKAAQEGLVYTDIREMR
jgi:hypothetical protein